MNISLSEYFWRFRLTFHFLHFSNYFVPILNKSAILCLSTITIFLVLYINSIIVQYLFHIVHFLAKHSFILSYGFILMSFFSFLWSNLHRLVEGNLRSSKYIKTNFLSFFYPYIFLNLDVGWVVILRMLLGFFGGVTYTESWKVILDLFLILSNLYLTLSCLFHLSSICLSSHSFIVK